jgi:3-phenylpropionate/cinnamic acid dioxygenase small subunit
VGPSPADTVGLADYIAIRELSARYNRFVDDCRYDDFARCFTDDGVFEVVGLVTMKGRAEIAEITSKFGFGPVHLTTDATIEIDGDEAHQVCSLLVGGRQKNRAAFRFLTTGRYDDRLVRTPDGWRFTHRRVDTDLAILQMASSIAAKNFVTRAAMVGAARAMAFTKRLAGRRTSN